MNSSMPALACPRRSCWSMFISLGRASVHTLTIVTSVTESSGLRLVLAPIWCLKSMRASPLTTRAPAHLVVKLAGDSLFDWPPAAFTSSLTICVGDGPTKFRPTLARVRGFRLHGESGPRLLILCLLSNCCTIVVLHLHRVVCMCCASFTHPNSPPSRCPTAHHV